MRCYLLALRCLPKPERPPAPSPAGPSGSALRFAADRRAGALPHRRSHTAADGVGAARRQNCFSPSHTHTPALNLLPQDESARSSLVGPSSRHPDPTLGQEDSISAPPPCTPGLQVEDEELGDLYLLLSRGPCYHLPLRLPGRPERESELLRGAEPG